MKRWHEEAAYMYRQWKRRYCMFNDTIAIEDRRSRGYFRKRKSFDCGKSRCYICHSDKLPKREITRQELFSDWKLKESKNDL